MESETTRKTALLTFLHTALKGQAYTLTALLHDASFRTYSRVQVANQSYVVMDAPPDKENVTRFIAVADYLRMHGVCTPVIEASDIDQGFLLLSDFGQTTYLSALQADNADLLYQRALVSLATLQACLQDLPFELPHFGAAWMLQEWAWHKEWFLQTLLNLNLAEVGAALDACYANLVSEIQGQPLVFMHRDYHSANLMVLPEDVGILDFQDAYLGPITYDLASLLRDCYIDWPEAKVSAWVRNYYDLLQKRGQLQGITYSTFMRWFDWMSVQRHLKALFTFARKAKRDHQLRYLQSVPRTLQYLQQTTARYPELAPLHQFLIDAVVPAFREVNQTCVP